MLTIFFVQARYDEALPMEIRSLSIRGDVLGPKHIDVANSFNSLGLLYIEQVSINHCCRFMCCVGNGCVFRQL